MKNLFNVNEEVFIISSDNLNSVKNKLYGFIVSENGIIDKDNFMPEKINKPEGCGYYVLVKKTEENVSIYQDNNAAYGLYFFSYKNYFALSNSYQYLVDYLKNKYELTIDVEYANHMFGMSYVGIAYDRTMIEEIKLLPKNIIIHIDCNRKDIYFEYIDYEECTIAIDSPEGIRTLDAWVKKWINIIRNLKKNNANMQVSLSGGMDSRITFMLMLLSGIDLNEVKIFSTEEKVHTFLEDYKIAKLIVEKYGYKLNQNVIDSEMLNYSKEDILNMIVYSNFYCHRQIDPCTQRRKQKLYHVRGNAGECIRAENINDFRSSTLKNNETRTVNEAVNKIYQETFSKIRENYVVSEDDSPEMAMRIYRDIAYRNHVGSYGIIEFWGNEYRLTPFVDPLLWKLKLYTDGCLDYNLLTAIIYVRYCPELLRFKFNNNRYILENTIQFAKKISDKYSVSLKELLLNTDDEFDVNVIDSHMCCNGNIENIDGNFYLNVFRKAFLSKQCRELFFSKFEFQTYYNAWRYGSTHKYFPLQGVCSVLSVVKAMMDVSGKSTDNAYNDFVSMSANSENNIIDSLNYFDKNQSLYEIIRCIISWSGSSNSLENICTANNYNKIIIYGYGALGKLMYRELIDSKISVVGIMDININYIRLGREKDIMKSFDNNEIEYDAILVTAIGDFYHIKNMLEGYNHHSIINMKELILNR